jgi:hypothetical protein
MPNTDDLPEQDVYPWKDSYDSRGVDPYAWWLRYLGEQAPDGQEPDTRQP